MPRPSQGRQDDEPGTDQSRIGGRGPGEPGSAAGAAGAGGGAGRYDRDGRSDGLQHQVQLRGEPAAAKPEEALPGDGAESGPGARMAGGGGDGLAGAADEPRDPRGHAGSGRGARDDGRARQLDRPESLRSETGPADDALGRLGG